MKMRVLGCLLVVFFCGIVITPAFAAVTIAPDFKGSFIVTGPNGKSAIINQGEALPNIGSGSTLEVSAADLTLSAENGDSVTLRCHHGQAVISDGAEISLSSSEKEGRLRVLKGKVKIVDAQGQVHEIAAGEEFVFSAVPSQIAPATAESDDAAGDPLDGDLAAEPPVDSRSMETSPAL